MVYLCRSQRTKRLLFTSLVALILKLAHKTCAENIHKAWIFTARAKWAAHIQKHKHTNTYTHSHSQTRTNTHTHTHTHTHIHTHKHTQAQTQQVLLLFFRRDCSEIAIYSYSFLARSTQRVCCTLRASRSFLCLLILLCRSKQTQKFFHTSVVMYLYFFRFCARCFSCLFVCTCSN